MTAGQLETLCTDAGETFDENVTKAEASKMIDELRRTVAATRRGLTGTGVAPFGWRRHGKEGREGREEESREAGTDQPGHG
jgi:hypothetical protein